MNNDLISREALKRKLQYVYSCDYIDSKSKEGIASDIIDEIDNAPTVEERPQGEWIPVSERLPEKSGKYWCTFGGTNLTGIDYYTTESDAKELFDDSDDLEEDIGWQSQNVIAWMPLPEPYKETENEKDSSSM